MSETPRAVVRYAVRIFDDRVIVNSDAPFGRSTVKKIHPWFRRGGDPKKSQFPAVCALDISLRTNSRTPAPKSDAAHPQSSVTPDRLRAAIRPLIRGTGSRTAGCGLPLAAGVTLALAQDGSRSASPLARCRNPWTCPVCAAALTELRLTAVQPQAEALRQSGHAAISLTLTLRFPEGAQSLADRRSTFTAALAGLLRRRGWSRWVAEYVVGLDVELRPQGGPHLHAHALLLLRPGSDQAQARRAIVDSWQDAAQAAGGWANAGSQAWSPLDSAVDVARALAYVVQAPAAVSARHPGSVRAAIVAAAAGDAAAGCSLRDLAQGTGRLRQLRASRGLSLIADAQDNTDAMDAPAPALTVPVPTGNEDAPAEVQPGPVAWIPRDGVAQLQAEGRWSALRQVWRVTPPATLLPALAAILRRVPGSRLLLPGVGWQTPEQVAVIFVCTR